LYLELTPNKGETNNAKGSRNSGHGKIASNARNTNWEMLKRSFIIGFRYRVKCGLR